MPVYIEKPILVTTQVDVKPENKAAFVDWEAKFNTCVTSAPGFVSLEFSSLPSEKDSWLIVQRFANEHTAQQWQGSKQYAAIFGELKAIINEEGVKQMPANGSGGIGNVTEVLVTEVHPDKEAAYRAWSAKIHQVEAKFPGFRGVYIQAPTSAQGKHWITLLQFDTMENLDRWLQSPERKEVLKESASLICSLESHRVISPYAGWFASIAKRGELPPVWKQTMVVLLVLFPIVVIELKYLSPLLGSLNPALKTFISNAISVTLISFPMMPIAIRGLNWWLIGHEPKVGVVGTLLVLLLYAAEIYLLWNFL